MAAVSMCNDSDGFTRWLETRLLQLNDDLDAGVFVMYIYGILESYSEYDEKKDSLLDIVGEIAEDSKEEICDEMIKKWDEMCSVDSKENQNETNTTSLDEKLSQMLTNTHVGTSNAEKKAKQLNEEELAQKRAILVQYSTICDEAEQPIELSEPEVIQPGANASVPSNIADMIPVVTASGNNQNAAASKRLLVNTNRDSIQRQEKEMREKMKVENEKKKEKDKLDRDAQKNKRQDRKENEKKRTQKGEKRR